MMGDGIAIQLYEETINAPISGVVSMVAPSKHAIGITSSSGVELLIHIGLDTVQLNGEGFDILVEENDEITLHQPLIHFDRKQIESYGYDIVIPIIITNSSEFNEIILTEEREITKDIEIMKIISK